MSLSKFTPPPAGAAVKPLTDVSSYYRRQVFTRTPCTGDSFVGGKELQFSFSASGNDFFVPAESRLVVRLNVRSNLDAAAGGSAEIAGAAGTHKRHPKKSVRFATAAPARLFSSGRVSIGGTTIENTGADLAEISTIMLRTEGTKPGEAAGGAAGLLGFDQTMTHPEVAAGAATALAYNTTAPRSDKHQLLLDRRGDDLELSIPLGMLFAFFRQTDSFMPNMEFDVRLVVNPHFSNDALFTADIAAVPRAQGVEFAAVPNVVQVGAGAGSAAPAALNLGWNGTDAVDRTFAQLLPAITAAANDSHKITVNEAFCDLMYASPSIPLEQPLSMQVPFSGITLYTRNLTAGQQSFTEVFSGLSASVSAVILALRVDDHTLATNRELYLAGGDPAGGSFATAQLSIGSLIQPSPSYDISPPERRVGRAMADYLSFVGGSHSDPAGGMNVSEYCQAPLLTFRVLQPSSTFSPTATVRFTTNGVVPAGAQLMFFAVHQRVFEATWAPGATNPSSVLVDEVVAA
eukprot:COSAG06_NODE_347_length_17007_cov_379.165306_3_plen_517_part_00